MSARKVQRRGAFLRWRRIAPVIAACCVFTATACSFAASPAAPVGPDLSASASPARPAAQPTVLSATEQIQWFTRLEVPYRRDCYGVKLDYMRVLTSLECARPGVVESLRLELDPAATRFAVGVRSIIIPLESAGVQGVSRGGSAMGVALVVLRKTGNARRSVPLSLSGAVAGRPLSHLVVPPPLETGEATGSGVSVPVEVVDGFPVPPGTVAVAPVSGGYELVDCNVGSGTPILVELPAGRALAGVVASPGSCDGRVPSLVSLVDHWAPWVVQASLCSQNQQSFSVDGVAAALSCPFARL